MTKENLEIKTEGCSFLRVGMGCVPNRLCVKGDYTKCATYNKISINKNLKGVKYN